MASSVRLFLTGTGSLISFTVVYLLVFVNGIVTEPLNRFIMGGTYRIAFGIDMIPVIQNAILALALGTCILCVILTAIGIYEEVSYYPEL